MLHSALCAMLIARCSDNAGRFLNALKSALDTMYPTVASASTTNEVGVFFRRNYVLVSVRYFQCVGKLGMSQRFSHDNELLHRAASVVPLVEVHGDASLGRALVGALLHPKVLLSAFGVSNLKRALEIRGALLPIYEEALGGDAAIKRSHGLLRGDSSIVHSFIAGVARGTGASKAACLPLDWPMLPVQFVAEACQRGAASSDDDNLERILGSGADCALAISRALCSSDARIGAAFIVRMLRCVLSFARGLAFDDAIARPLCALYQHHIRFKTKSLWLERAGEIWASLP